MENLALKDLLTVFGRLDWRQAKGESMVQLVTGDSRLVHGASVFVALRGSNIDGHDFIDQAIQRGAMALVVESTKNIPTTYNGAVLEVLNSKWAFAEFLSFMYKKPQDQLLSIGITGTNGKTSTSYILEAILNQAQMPCGVMGTINHHLGNKVWKTQLTTPETTTFFQRLAEFVKAGAKSFVMEVSSHGLKQQRVPISFDYGIFTNLSRDHLDYHKTMEDYLASKSLLFSQHLKTTSDSFAIINDDDPWSKQLQLGKNVFKLGYGKTSKDFSFKVMTTDFSGSHFELTTPQEQKALFATTMIGEHNIYNAVAALAVGYTLNINPVTMQKALGGFLGVPGRLQKVPCDQRHIFVDYAHTPDALEKVLQTLNDIRAKHNISCRIHCVFGCGGDRDKGKRPLMAEVASRLSDKVIVTSDNPRSEDPMTIIKEIQIGLIPSRPYVTEVDRKLAIAEALSQSASGDVILIAGKGHEDYQIVGDQVLPFDDALVAQEILKKMGLR